MTKKQRIEIVEDVRKYLEKRLRRKLIASSGRDYSYKRVTLFDPTFLSLQRSSPVQGRGRYSQGFNIYFEDGFICFGFRIVHSRYMIRNFKKNLNEKELRTIIKRLCRVRSKAIDQYPESLHLQWSSRAEINRSGKKLHFASVRFETINQLVKELATLGITNLHDDINTNPLQNTYKKSTRPTEFGRSRGSDFWLNFRIKDYDYQQVLRNIRHFEPLFLALYPNEPDFQRNDGLLGKLNTHYRNIGLNKECAFIKCKRKSNLEAAHIKPYRKGGSDHHSNGIFLCKEHHLLQEAKSFAEQRNFLKTKVIRHTRLM